MAAFGTIVKKVGMGASKVVRSPITRKALATGSKLAAVGSVVNPALAPVAAGLGAAAKVVGAIQEGLNA